MDQPQQILSSFYKNANFNELDPSLTAPCTNNLLEIAIPTKLKIQQENLQEQDLSNEMISFKLLGSQQLQSTNNQMKFSNQNITNQMNKLEVTTDTDIFFNYSTVLDQPTFMKLKKEQQLQMEFADFIPFIIKLFINVMQNPDQYQNQLLLNQDGYARLDFIEALPYKNVNILSIDLFATAEDNVRKNILFRYNVIRAKKLIVQNKISQIFEVLQENNPQLLTMIQRNVSAFQANSYSPNPI